MWICAKDGFVSIVHKDCKADELLVRARAPGHIESIFPNAKVRETPGNDYLYRAVIKRKEFGRVVTDIGHHYKADNFKNSVSNHALHSAYASVWHVMAKLQSIAPFSRQPRQPVAQPLGELLAGDPKFM
jgi:hypothetical protein